MKSALFIPCEERKLNKLKDVNADLIIFDLEDSIKESQKLAALDMLVETLGEYADKSNFAVRVNRQTFVEEIDILYRCGIRGFMIPKSEDAKEIQVLASRYDDIKLVLLIETAMGVLNVKQLCQCEKVEAVAFGAEDFCSQTGIANRQDILLPIKEAIVVAAKAFSKIVYDTITLEINDDKDIRESIISSRDLGFDGKLCIHPKQVSIINEINCIDNAQEWEEIIELFDKNTEGVLVYKGQVYEKPHIDNMRRGLYEAR